MWELGCGRGCVWKPIHLGPSSLDCTWPKVGNVVFLSLGGTKAVLSLHRDGAPGIWEMRRLKCGNTCGLSTPRREIGTFEVCGLIWALKIPHTPLKSCFSSRLLGWPCSAALRWGLFFPLCPIKPRSWDEGLIRTRLWAHVCWPNPCLCKAPTCFHRALSLIVLCKDSEDLHQKGSWHLKPSFLGRPRWDWAQNVVCAVRITGYVVISCAVL